MPRLRLLALPALANAGRTVTLDQESSDHAVIEALLRRGVSRFGGGRFGEAGLALFGLDAGTRGETSRVRREIAAEAFGRTYETFRKNQEPLLIGQLAQQILVLCSEQRTRDARRSQVAINSPQDSIMAQVWLERFATYYRIWTSVSGLGNDLTAYRSTLLESERPWDRRFGTTGSKDEGYSQEEQAEGYATFALYHFAHFAWLLRQFVTLYGGQWLLSDADAEQAVADAVYRISWHAPWNERDVSYLRTLVADTPDQEMHGFIERLRATELGRTTEQEWFEWAGSCACMWTLSPDMEQEYFPTGKWHQGISDHCQPHNLIRACGDYLDAIDVDWRRLADWYRIDLAPSRGISSAQLYEQASPDAIRSRE
jgi:hypothetical protein